MSRPDSRSATTHQQQWVPRGSSSSAASSLLPTPPPPATSNSRPNANPNPSRHRHFPRQLPSDPPPASLSSSSSSSPSEMVPQLVQEIQEKLSRGTVECMICYDMVRRSSPIWSCSHCFSIFHLPCIRKWSRSPTSTASDHSSSWRCPGCQSLQSAILGPAAPVGSRFRRAASVGRGLRSCFVGIWHWKGRWLIAGFSRVMLSVGGFCLVGIISVRTSVTLGLVGSVSWFRRGLGGVVAGRRS